MTRKNSYDDFIRLQGLPFIANLLRRISDQMVEDAGRWEAEIGIQAPPRTASTLLLLKAKGPRSVTEIAEALGQSHPLVITWLRQLEKLRLVRRAADSADARRTLIGLTRAGIREADRMASASDHIGAAYKQLLREADAPIHDALWRLHDLLVAGRLADLLHINPSAAR